MKIINIALCDLVPHESMATQPRVAVVPNTKEAPIVVKKLAGIEKYYIVDGTNRAYKALNEGKKEVSAVLATPDHSDRLLKIAKQRVERNASFPLQALKLSKDDVERQYQFFKDTDKYSKRPYIKSNRGTIIKIKVNINFDGKQDIQFSLVQKGGLGGLIFDPNRAVDMFREGTISRKNIMDSWGNDGDYDYSVLPSYIELSNDGVDCWAAGYAFRQAFRDNDSQYSGSPVSSRGQILNISVFVLYPNGLVFEGDIILPKDPIMFLWSEELISNLKDQSYLTGFSASPHWWKNPTSIAFSRNKYDPFECPIAVHNCGSTCSGGGCTS